MHFAIDQTLEKNVSMQTITFYLSLSGTQLVAPHEKLNIFFNSLEHMVKFAPINA